MSDDQSHQLIRQMIARTVEFAADQGDPQATTEILLELNRLGAHIQSQRDQDASNGPLRRLFERLTTLVHQQRDALPYVQEMFVLLSDLSAAADLQTSVSEATSAKHRTAPRKPKKNTHYCIRHGARGIRLTESREGTDKNFYVDKQDYDAAVEALAQTAEDGADLDAIHTQFVALGGRELQSQYPLRVVIRFLRSRQPPLLTGGRRHYALTLEPVEFRKKASKAWEKLPHE